MDGFTKNRVLAKKRADFLAVSDYRLIDIVSIEFLTAVVQF